MTRPPSTWPADHVRVVVPARTSALRLLRVTAATAAADVVGSIHRLDDVRLVMGELAAAAIAVASPAAPLEVEVRVTADAVAVRGRTQGCGRPPELSPVGAMLVGTLCHDHELRADGNDLVFAFRMQRQPPV